ncbi:MAG: hypothetical protein KDE19_22275, partial [Caldilineaceae bacterium]|nr:hypothetical protein [Caldilineaceae bacterium]
MVVFPRTTTDQKQRTQLVRFQHKGQRSAWVRDTQALPRRLQSTSLRATMIGILLVLSVSTSTFAQSCPLYSSPHQRIGFNVAPDNGIDIDDYDAAQLGGGWYHNYGMRLNPHHPGGIQYHQLVLSSINRAKLPELVGPMIANNPGSLWILGNEPDHVSQGGLVA